MAIPNCPQEAPVWKTASQKEKQPNPNLLPDPVFFLAFAASLSWRVLARDPRHVTSRPQAAHASVTTETGVWGCGAPSTVGEESHAPGHSHPGFHGKNNASKRTATHIGSGGSTAEWWHARVGNTHNSTHTIMPDPLSIILAFR